MLNALVDIGRQYLDRPDTGDRIGGLVAQCHDLVSAHGEASGTALASRILDEYQALDDEGRLDLLHRLNDEFGIDSDTLAAAARGYADTPDDGTLRALSNAIEAPRQELFRRLNMAPGGTAAIVGMRQLILSRGKDHPELKNFESDLKHLLSSWFNRGFLQFEKIDWRTPAVILEKLIAYEAVHEIQGWEDLRRRLADDRRCFGFFHPALPDEPLIFVEVALTKGLAGEIHDLIDSEPEPDAAVTADSAIFYSISNCQAGLAGISFGNFLIKQVADEVQKELPQITQFATLSPIPGFRAWLDDKLVKDTPDFLTEDETDLLSRSDWRENELIRQPLKSALMRLCATYLIDEKIRDRPRDPVARFHLGNGASVERINWAADLSAKGIDQSAGMMVNYLYDRSQIVSNHEAYVRDGVIATSSSVAKLAKGKD
ncbi:MAG: malonyl-CoA decarboxylase [Alphaproteobacteria bacterium]